VRAVGNSFWRITVAEIPRVSRLVRSVVLSLREQPYVDAGQLRHANADDHPAPHPANTVAPMLVQATISAPAP